VGAVFDDAVEDLVEAVDAAVLTFDSAELHGWDCNGLERSSRGVVMGDWRVMKFFGVENEAR
jgi:hypothetical protein